MQRFVLIVTRRGKVYISFHSNSKFLGFSTLSISYILYSSLLFSFSKQ